MTRRSGRNKRAQRGSSSVELALLVPVITLLVVGTIDLGRGMWAKHSLEHVVGDAVRVAVVQGSTSEQPATQSSMTTWVQNALPHLRPKDLTVVTTWSPNNRPGSDVTVSVIYDFDPLIPFLPLETLALTANATSVIAY
jgi:Flp pilus assembly protein TadG